MPQDTFEYGKWVEEALRRVVRRSLEEAGDGMTGAHHFYVTFRTDAAGVEIPDYLHKQYPAEMTIVLQHQYWNLRTFGTYFQVTLSFNRVNETLTIPYAALTSFSDPSVNFGLQLKMVDGADMDLGESETPKTAPKRSLPAAVPASDKPGLPAPMAVPVKAEAVPKAKRKTAASAAEDAAEPEPRKAAEVIAIDAFRKK